MEILLITILVLAGSLIQAFYFVATGWFATPRDTGEIEGALDSRYDALVSDATAPLFDGVA